MEFEIDSFEPEWPESLDIEFGFVKLLDLVKNLTRNNNLEIVGLDSNICTDTCQILDPETDMELGFIYHHNWHTNNTDSTFFEIELHNTPIPDPYK